MNLKLRVTPSLKCKHDSDDLSLGRPLLLRLAFDCAWNSFRIEVAPGNISARKL
jgi:hypothetical protein